MCRLDFLYNPLLCSCLSFFCVKVARKKRQAGIDKRLDTIACLFFFRMEQEKRDKLVKRAREQAEEEEKGKF